MQRRTYCQPLMLGVLWWQIGPVKLSLAALLIGGVFGGNQWDTWRLLAPLHSPVVEVGALVFVVGGRLGIFWASFFAFCVALCPLFGRVPTFLRVRATRHPSASRTALHRAMACHVRFVGSACWNSCHTGGAP